MIPAKPRPNCTACEAQTDVGYDGCRACAVRRVAGMSPVLRRAWLAEAAIGTGPIVLSKFAAEVEIYRVTKRRTAP